MAPFTVEEANSIYRLSQVDRFMQANRGFQINHNYDIPNIAGYSRDHERLYIDRDVQPWRWLGRMVDPKMYLILRELTTMSIMDALHTLTGRELQAVLIRMRMVNADDAPFEHAVGVAIGAVDYAVGLQYGPSGLKSYHRHMKKQIKGADRLHRLPIDLALEPYAADIALRVLMATKMEPVHG